MGHTIKPGRPEHGTPAERRNTTGTTEHHRNTERGTPVPTHLVFLNHVVRVDTLNQVFGIRTILSAFLPQQNRDYKRQHGSNQVVFL